MNHDARSGAAGAVGDGTRATNASISTLSLSLSLILILALLLVLVLLLVLGLGLALALALMIGRFSATMRGARHQGRSRTTNRSSVAKVVRPVGRSSSSGARAARAVDSARFAVKRSSSRVLREGDGKSHTISRAGDLYDTFAAAATGENARGAKVGGVPFEERIITIAVARSRRSDRTGGHRRDTRARLVYGQATVREGTGRHETSKDRRSGTRVSHRSRHERSVGTELEAAHVERANGSDRVGSTTSRRGGCVVNAIAVVAIGNLNGVRLNTIVNSADRSDASLSVSILRAR